MSKHQLKEDDFVFIKSDAKYSDYWFSVKGDSKAELEERYGEQSMIEISEVVFSISDGLYGVKRLFPFNYDVVTPNDPELEKILRSKAFETLQQFKA